MAMVVCVPVDVDGSVDPRWGRADRVAIVQASPEGITDWQEFDVGWSTLHDSGGEGSHHARVVRFLREHKVGSVVAHHMGPGMVHTLDRMGLPVHLGAAGDAREAVLTALGGAPS